MLNSAAWTDCRWGSAIRWECMQRMRLFREWAGMRTAGDLVARMQLNRGMRIDAAKQYVAEKN